ncbi:hypothetical protein LCGC14_0357250 [marine sediment metagenome]|uniref:Uncharacterized protein n=1 Tax=marine sediment metagenome TaxID=412755 RepID=A0A0F9VWB0_9ZZZZ
MSDINLIRDVCDYYINYYPVKGDNFTADMIADDAKRLAEFVNRLPMTADDVPIIVSERPHVWVQADRHGQPKAESFSLWCELCIESIDVSHLIGHIAGRLVEGFPVSKCYYYKENIPDD